jgi:aminopeptidase N
MKKISLLALILIAVSASAQSHRFKETYTLADTLRGSIGEGRDWWDLLHYDIHAAFNIPGKSIKGYCAIRYRVLKPGRIMQIDLQSPMQIDSCVFVSSKDLQRKICKAYSGKNAPDAYFTEAPAGQETNGIYTLEVYYHGQPKIAINAPWDGGVVWTKDAKGNPWVSIACEGLGSSVWYPCKDHQADEVDSAALHITCPDTLMGIGNGRLRGITINGDGTSTYNWAVTNPINNYNIIPYIGKYTYFGEVYNGEAGPLDMDYWVLSYNLDKAKKHFTDATREMKAFEYWFGPYPFYKDSYKLVEAPYLGMEHQSDIAYGNDYLMGYKGRDMSGTGWGLKWDFLIVHESGHEWFGNNISCKDVADMWIHEGFTNYSETLFTDYFYGKEAGNAYCIGSRQNIDNDIPIIGVYGVHKEGSSDMYCKGGAMLHNIRQIFDNDTKFREMLRGLNRDFYHQTVTTQQIETYISKAAGKDLSKVFDQYLRTIQVPVLSCKLEKGAFIYKWTNCVDGFDMPVKVSFGKGKYAFIYPTTQAQQLKTKMKSIEELKVDPDFYVLMLGQ